MFTQLNQYHVILEVEPQFPARPQDLRELFIRSGVATAGASSTRRGSASDSAFGTPDDAVGGGTSTSSGASSAARHQRPRSAAARRVDDGFQNGNQVPLSAFTHVEQTTAPMTISHQGQFPVVTLSFNLAPGVSLGDGGRRP